MIRFKCACCNAEYKFSILPVPDGGANFKCAKCGKTCILINHNGTIVCRKDTVSPTTPPSKSGELSRSSQQRDREYTPEMINAHLQGYRPELPFDVKLVIGITQGPDEGVSIPIKKPVITIGKTGCDINLSDTTVSREHCRIEIYGNKMTIVKDLGSNFGTYRNGVPISVSVLVPGDTLQVGQTRLTFIRNVKKETPKFR